MSGYVVLARKYRPQKFDDLVGQSVVAQVLRGAIEEDRVAHAYLFCGPRGTGKTTTARIIAKTLNCEARQGLDPCNVCDRCTAADAGAEPDIVEIDAASHTGVDHIRDLRDQAAYAPMRARYKVYVIDEVHMLSRGAFNALLKTLEEPPPHVKFLFATTELHKVPDTIQSRCQVLHLHPIREPEIAARLHEIAGLEGIEAEEGVLSELARRARGGMRDALSLFDQLLALAGKTPTLEDVARMADGGSSRELNELLTHVENGDRAAALGALPARHGGEAGLVDDILEHVRSCLVASLCGENSPHLQGSDEARLAMAERGKRLGADRLELWLGEWLHARERIRVMGEHARSILELTILDLCHPDRTLPLTELEARLARLEERLGGASAGTSPVAPAAKAAGPAPSAARTSAPPSPAPSEARPESAAPARPPESARAPESARPPESARAAESARPPESKAELQPAAPQRPAAKVERPAARGQAAAAPPTKPAEIWVRFLDELGKAAAGMVEVLRRSARLEDVSPERVVIELKGLDAADRRMTKNARNLATCQRVIGEILGREVKLVMNESQTSEKRSADPFTDSVASLFDGTIEEGS